MSKILFLFMLCVTAALQSCSSQAVNDTYTRLQAKADTLAVTANDTRAAGDTVCISLVSGSASFTVLDCAHLLHRADSLFTGYDTCYYALCNTANKCDTAMVVVQVLPDAALLPVASFVEDTTLFITDRGHFFCGSERVSYGWDYYMLVNTSNNADHVIWTATGIALDTTHNISYSGPGDTIVFMPYDLSPYSVQTRVCLTAYNRFGSSTVCHTSCMLVDPSTGISEPTTTAISAYPNPCTDVLHIDLPTDQTYTISVYDVRGARVYSSEVSNTSSNVSIPMAAQPAGLYLWVAEPHDASGTGQKRLTGKVMKP